MMMMMTMMIAAGDVMTVMMMIRRMMTMTEGAPKISNGDPEASTRLPTCSQGAPQTQTP